MSTAAIAATNANSATTSRDAVPSIEFSTGSVEPQVRGDRGRVQTERRARQRTRTVRRACGTGVPVLPALDVPQERPDVREQVVREQDRLGVLQVRATRHRRVARGRGLVGERVGDVQQQPADQTRLLAQVHAHERGDLVVAGPARPELAAEIGARTVDQPALEGGVHVLVGDHGQEVAVADVGREPLEGVDHPGQLVVGQQTRAVQDARVRDRAGDVVLREPPVEVRRLRQRLQRLRRAAGEPAAPEGRRRGRDGRTASRPRQAPIPPCEPRSTPLPKRTSRAAASLELRP